MSVGELFMEIEQREREREKNPKPNDCEYIRTNQQNKKTHENINEKSHLCSQNDSIVL